MALNLFDLPVEVRCIIYTHLFTGESIDVGEPVTHGLSEPRNVKSNRQNHPALPPIFAVCQQLADEAQAIYYSNVLVKLNIGKNDSLDTLVDWFRTIEQNGCIRHLRHLQIRWHEYVDVGIDLTRHASNASGQSAAATFDPPSTCTRHVATAAEEQNNGKSLVPGIGQHDRKTDLVDDGGLIVGCINGLHNEHIVPNTARSRLDDQGTNRISGRDSAFHVLSGPTHSSSQLSFPNEEDHLYKNRFSCDPPLSIRTGRNHVITVAGIRRHQMDRVVWERCGTAAFCDTLSSWLGRHLSDLLADGRVFLTVAEITRLLLDLDERASSLRWLWFW